MKLTLVSFLLVSNFIYAQSPSYTIKKFAGVNDTAKFKSYTDQKTGTSTTYILTKTEVMDVDDNQTTFIRGNVSAILCFNGIMKNKKREGVFSISLIDSLDSRKRYIIGKQMFQNDKLNGTWTTYTLSGKIFSQENYKNDSLNGLSRYFDVDGKTVIYETEFSNGSSIFLQRNFYPNGKVKSEIPYKDGWKDGIGKIYYDNGMVQQVAVFNNNKFDGSYKYYYPNGQVWVVEIYKEGKDWEIVANYTEKGIKRDAGTLKDGNGTVIYYDDNGNIREVMKYKNGKKIQE